jgi:hypothetical protein
VKSPFDNPDALESHFLKNTEIDPTHPGCWRWRGPAVKSRRCRKKEGVMQAIYRIAFKHFKGPIPDKHVVHHTCRNPHCVNPDHLKALTQGEHISVHRNGNGEKNKHAVLTDEEVREIFDLVEKGLLQRKIAKIYGVTQPCISNLLHNRRWPHVYAEVFKGAPPKDFRFRSGLARQLAQ